MNTYSSTLRRSRILIFRKNEDFLTESHNRILYLFAFFLFFVPFMLSAQSKSEKLDSLFQALYEQQAFNGNVLIAEEGEVIYQNSLGIANEITREKLKAESIFNLASLTKQFTAMAIVLLHRQGKLDVEDDFTDYLPELKAYNNIRIQDLITHQSGLPSYMAVMDETWDKEVIATNKQVIAQFAKQQPDILFAPRTSWEYNNTGYVFLAEIIQRTSGMSYPEFLRKHIFEPLNMTNSSVILRFKDSVVLPNLTESYVDAPGVEKTEPYNTEEYDYVTYLDGVYGQGRMHSTTEDLFKWDQGLSSKFLSDSERALVFTSRKTADGEDTCYGYGWYITDHPTYGKIVYHTGDWTGYRTRIERHLDSDKTVIWLQNNDLESTVLPDEQIWGILY